MRLFAFRVYFCDIIMHIVLSGPVRTNNQLTEQIIVSFKKFLMYFILFLYYMN